MVNGLSVDLEDWLQSVYDPHYPLTDCFRRNTHRVLELLAEHGVRATFFVLGLAARKAPELVRELVAAGHEVQSHGYGHRPVHAQSPAAFRADVQRARDLLEDLIGQKVTAYRAPAFSIDERTPWAIDVLAECDVAYDSSIFPIRMRRYGLSGCPRVPFTLRTAAGSRILEMPVASYRLGPVRVPAGGGGYLRTFPLLPIRAAIGQLNAAGHPGVVYLHPYEFAPREFSELAVRIPWRVRLHQGLGRRGMPRKVSRLLQEFRFAPMGTVAAATGETPAVGWPLRSATEADDGSHCDPQHSVRAYCGSPSQT